MARKDEFTTQIDLHVGKKINELRLAMGLSRQQLAKVIGVTHQQLQKYETGLNRISIGRLVLIGKSLKKPTSYFIDDMEYDLPNNHKRMCIEVSRNFAKVKNPKHQEAINNLIKVLSKGD